MNVMLCLGLAGLMGTIGVALRAMVKPFRNILVPATVLGGLIGCIFMNVISLKKIDIGVNANLCTTIVGYLFILSFISLGLTKSERKKSSLDDKKNDGGVARAAYAFGAIYGVCFSLQAVLGFFLIEIFGKGYGMNAIYGMLIPFGYCEGPGSAATYASIYQKYGWNDAMAVAVTFSVIGFVGAFAIGVPLAKYGIKKKIARHAGKLNYSVSRGFYSSEEQRESLGKITTHAGSIDTLSFHLCVIFVCYLLAIGLSKLLALIPGFIGESLSGLVFISGLACGMIVRMILNKLKLSHLLNDALLSKITGMTTDFLIILAFMGVQFSVVEKWMVPILIECLVISAVTVMSCLILGSRMVGTNDFERTLGIYGACSGTTPNGVALIRMVDPKMKTPSIMELGLMNIPGTIYLAVAGTVVLGTASGAYSYIIATLILIGLAVLVVVTAYLTKCFGRKRYGFSAKWIARLNEELEKENNVSVKGTLNINK